MAQHASHVPRPERKLTPTATMAALPAPLAARSHAGSRRSAGWSAGGIRPRDNGNQRFRHWEQYVALATTAPVPPLG